MSIVIFFPMLLLAGLAMLIVLILAAARRPSHQPPPVRSVAPLEMNPPGTRNQRREEILAKLASKEISRDEAERQLIELDHPLPEQMPPAPPASGRSGCGTGCLIILLCFLSLPLLLLVMRFFGIWLIHV